jgi:hypothetical protein
LTISGAANCLIENRLSKYCVIAANSTPPTSPR